MTQPHVRLDAALAGRYRVEHELGAGGMATVFLAHDLRHDRPVALKVLRPELAAVIGGERFLHEIKTTANLQHPHILPLFDSGEADTFLFYVMPYVEGESLRHRLVRERQLPIAEAVRIATEVAGALDYAHRRGVIHRDIKPENILLHDGRALVADFGIALAVQQAGGNRLTETGLSLGTPQYMSPEQATADKTIGPRSDVYSLGAVLYEMLTGDPPHTGSSAQAVIAALVTEEPKPVTARRKLVPPHVAAAVDTALRKLPADRFATAGEFAEALADDTRGRHLAPMLGMRLRSRGPLALGVGVAAAVLLLVAGVLIGRMTSARAESEPRVVRSVIPLESGAGLSTAPAQLLALSPDGSTLVYASSAALVGAPMQVRPLDASTSRPIQGSEGGVNPVFSADGRSLLFRDTRTRALHRVPLEGGTPRLIASNSSRSSGVAWRQDGVVLYRVPEEPGVLALDSSKSEPTLLIRADTSAGELILDFPDPLPGGEAYLVTFTALGLASARLGGAGIAVVWPGSGKRKVLVPEGAGGARYSPTGHIVYVLEDGTLVAAPFDAERGELTGPAVPIARGVRISGTGGPAFAISRNGVLAYAKDDPAELVLVDRAGRAVVASALRRQYHSPRLSPDGRRVALDVSDAGDRNVWVHDLEQGTLTRVTFEGGGHDPVWTLDGRRICYGGFREGRVTALCRNADGTGEPELLQGSPEADFTPGAWLPSGRAITIAQTAATSMDLWEVTPGGAKRPLLQGRYDEGFPAASPDGRWLAYASSESGEFEVYVRPLAGPATRIQVSRGGGSEPVWSRDGRELFYLETSGSERQLVAAKVAAGPEFRVVSREVLFDASGYEAAVPHSNYDVSPDGQRFVMVRRAAASEIHLVQNWHLLVAQGDGEAGARRGNPVR